MDYFDIMAAKRAGRAHTADELAWFARAIADRSLSDARLAAWIMAVAIQGLDDEETHALTAAMRDSGPELQLASMPSPRADKHSTGGVGDKVSLAAVPLAAACGVSVLKLTGRALGFTGGTADKLESLPGVRTELSLDEACRQVGAIGAAFVVQSAHWAPADKRMYALRDEIGAIDSIPLIAASIMSKKLAARPDALVLDVKVGSGTFMVGMEDARRLAQLMMRIGHAEGVRTEALLTDMNAPLGRAIGTGLELAEAWDLLLNPGRADERLLALTRVVAEAMIASALGLSSSEAARRIELALKAGEGAAMLDRILAAQGGGATATPTPDNIPRAPHEVVVQAGEDGYVAAIEPRPLGRLARELASTHPGAGVLLEAGLGSPVRRGEPLARVRALSPDEADRAATTVRAAFRIAPERPELGPIILDRLRP